MDLKKSNNIQKPVIPLKNIGDKNSPVGNIKRSGPRKENPFRIKKIISAPEKLIAPTTEENRSNPRVERETANLNVKERNKLRDLWMAQRGMVHGKTIDFKTKIDLRKESQGIEEKKEFVAYEGKLLRTTHRKLAGPGKIVNLRQSASASPNSQKNDIFPQKKDTRKTILLPLFNIKLFSIFVIFIALVLIIIISVVLPEAKIRIQPRVSSEDLEFKSWISGEVTETNFAEHTIPGNPVRLKITKEQSFATASEKEVAKNSRGLITILNRANEPLSLKQNSVLTDNNGKKFILASPVTVPAAKQKSDTNGNGNANINASATTVSPGSAVAEITAGGTGNEYNLKEGAELTASGLADTSFQGQVTIQTKKNMDSGETKKIKYIAQEDIDKAREELLSRAKEEALAELRKRAGDNGMLSLPPEIMREENIIFKTSQSAGTEADSFQANLEADYFALFFKEKDLIGLAKQIIEGDQIEKGGEATISRYNPMEIKPLENKMEISANVNYKLISKSNADEIKKHLTAKNKREALDYLRTNRDFADFKVELWPNWLPYMPLLERRIQVEIN